MDGWQDEQMDGWLDHPEAHLFYPETPYMYMENHPYTQEDLFTKSNLIYIASDVIEHGR